MAPFAHSAFRLDLDPRVAHSMRLRADPRTHCGAPANHHDSSAIHVLAARFPVIRRMVGEQSFRVTAQRFVLSEPPRVPIPPSYGESFPRFLRREGGLSSRNMSRISPRWRLRGAKRSTRRMRGRSMRIDPWLGKPSTPIMCASSFTRRCTSLPRAFRS